MLNNSLKQKQKFFIMTWIPYQESYPNLEQALRDGATIRISRSEKGLRIVRVEDENKNLISYGEHPLLCGALAHAEYDFGCSYEEQYSGEHSRHEHHSEGVPPKVHDVFDYYVYNHGADALTLHYSQRWNYFICMRPHPESFMENQIIWGSGSGVMQAMCECFIGHHVEDKMFFMNRMSIQKKN